MGEVYRARDTRLGRAVAVKVLPGGVVAHPEQRRRFEHEARAVSALNHPHICTLHDIGDAIPSGPQGPRRENHRRPLTSSLAFGSPGACRSRRATSRRSCGRPMARLLSMRCWREMMLIGSAP